MSTAVYRITWKRSSQLRRAWIGTRRPPQSTVVPTLAGVPAVGHTLRCAHGVWTNDGSPIYSYQWKRNGVAITDVGVNSTLSSYVLGSADDGTTITCTVTCTDSSGSGITTSDSLTIASSATVTWDPTQRQTWEPDTILLFDPDQEIAFWQNPIAGGYIDTTGKNDATPDRSNPWRSDSAFTLDAGKYRRSVHGISSYKIHAPGPSIPSNTFTIEFFVASDVNWSALSYDRMVAFGGVQADNGNDTIIIVQVFPGGALGATFANNTVNPVVFSQATTNVTTSFVANQWVSVALTYTGGIWKLYVDGVLRITSASGVTAPWCWDGPNIGNGLQILPVGANLKISDLRISRQARNLTPTTTAVTTASTVAFSNTSTGASVNGNLAGGLHNFAMSPSDIGNSTIEGFAAGLVKVARTGKATSTCPIKAGGTDASHPTLGHSGLYSYDFRPLDHSLDYYHRLGIRPYLNLDSTPQLLGGLTAPYNATQCADPTWLVQYGNFNKQVPSDFAAYATIAADFYHYVTYVRGDDMLAWCFWNEVDGPDFWAGTKTQMFDLWKATRNAIKAVNPGALLGGLEWADPASAEHFSSWVSEFIAYCAANDCPPDYISYHNFDGSIVRDRFMRSMIDRFCTTSGLSPAPALICGEAMWTYMPGVYQPYKNTYHQLLGAWAAAWLAGNMLCTQDTGVLLRIFVALMPQTPSGSYYISALSSAVNMWATRNVFAIWNMIAGQSVLTQTSSSLETGVFVLGAKDAIRWYVLAVNLNHRRDRETELKITMPLPVTGPATNYRIDRQTSNFLEAPTTEALSTSTAVSFTAGIGTLWMQPPAVHLLVINSPLISTVPAATATASAATPTVSVIIRPPVASATASAVGPTLIMPVFAQPPPATAIADPAEPRVTTVVLTPETPGSLVLTPEITH